MSNKKIRKSSRPSSEPAGENDEPLLKTSVSKEMHQQAQDGSRLMLRFMQGDEQAFEDLLNMHENGILNFFYRLTGERHAAEDMTQELFIKVYRYRDRYEPRATFKSFIYRMARNMWIDSYRKKKSRPTLVGFRASLDDKDRSSPDEYIVDDNTGSPPEAVAKEERLRKLEQAVARLPDKLREVVALCLEGKLRYAEISEMLGIPVGTIKSRMHAAVARLKELMGEV